MRETPEQRARQLEIERLGAINRAVIEDAGWKESQWCNEWTIVYGRPQSVPQFHGCDDLPAGPFDHCRLFHRKDPAGKREYMLVTEPYFCEKSHIAALRPWCERYALDFTYPHDSIHYHGACTGIWITARQDPQSVAHREASKREDRKCRHDHL